MKLILVDPNLVRTFYGNNFFDPNYGAHLWKWLFFGADWIRLFTVDLIFNLGQRPKKTVKQRRI